MLYIFLLWVVRAFALLICRLVSWLLACLLACSLAFFLGGGVFLFFFLVCFLVLFVFVCFFVLFFVVVGGFCLFVCFLAWFLLCLLICLFACMCKFQSCFGFRCPVCHWEPTFADYVWWTVCCVLVAPGESVRCICSHVLSQQSRRAYTSTHRAKILFN